MRVTDNPFEIGMDRLVDLEMEADFIGKEALKKIKKEGIKRKLVGIEILGDPITKVVPKKYTPEYFVPDHWPVTNDKKGNRLRYFKMLFASIKEKYRLCFSSNRIYQTWYRSEHQVTLRKFNS